MWNCLIIEDDLINARYIAQGFIDMGHQAQICSAGDQALKCALSDEWDLIVLDRMLPKGVDGLSILTAIRDRSEEHTSELQSRGHLVCRLLLEKKNKNKKSQFLQTTARE